MPASTRWIQLTIGVVCMALVANLQYGWTLFVTPMQAKYGWSLAAIQGAFFIFVLVETWLVPVEGWLVHKPSSGQALILGATKRPADDRVTPPPPRPSQRR